MYAVIVEFVIKPEAREAFAAAMRSQAKTSLESEPGCHQFDVLWPDDAPCDVTLYELYDDAEAFAAHLGTAHFKAFDAQVADMIVSKTVRTARRRVP
jgi:quinol monooxygenase YgiN